MIRPKPASCVPACRSSRPSTPSKQPWKPIARATAALRPARLQVAIMAAENQVAVAPVPMAPAAPASTTPTVSLKTWIAVIGATIGAFMAVLNIQIVNASLADIQGAIGAGIDDGGGALTAYLGAEIIVIPLTGWFARVFSVRIYLLTNAVLFLLLSIACAL